ncbi:hypothetical protein BaRGS_00035214, partial [Batillaria attramentaria]
CTRLLLPTEKHPVTSLCPSHTQHVMSTDCSRQPDATTHVLLSASNERDRRNTANCKMFCFFLTQSLFDFDMFGKISRETRTLIIFGNSTTCERKLDDLA